MERYEAYKDSGVEWIGEMPARLTNESAEILAEIRELEASIASRLEGVLK